MKKLLLLGLFAPLSINAQTVAQIEIFTTGGNVDMLEVPQKWVFIMDYNTQTGAVNGEKVTITKADCQPEQGQTIIHYKQKNTLYELVFQFNKKGKYSSFKQPTIINQVIK